jgi:hypothetical protein
MSLESITSSVREALMSTQLSEAEVLRKMGEAKRRRFRKVQESRSGHGGAVWLFALAGASAAALSATFYCLTLPAPSMHATEDKWVQSRGANEGSKPRESARKVRVDERKSAVPGESQNVDTAVRSHSGRPSPSARSADSPLKRGVRATAEASGRTPPSWGQVLEAMRAGDEGHAQSLMRRLEESSDAETRDNARLTRLEFRLSAASGALLTDSEVKELGELQMRGASSSVRAGARRLLERVRHLQNVSMRGAQTKGSE